jgi:hypothetical protein
MPDEDRSLFYMIVTAASQLEPQTAADILWRLYLRSNNALEKTPALIRALAGCGTAPAMRRVEELVRSGDARFAVVAIDSMKSNPKIDAPDVLDLRSRILDQAKVHPSADVRRAAVRSARKILLTRAAEFLRSVAETDPDESVRAAAREELAR